MTTITVDFIGASESTSNEYDLSLFSSWEDVKEAIDKDMTAEYDQWEIADYDEVPRRYHGEDSVHDEYWEYLNLCDMLGRSVVCAGLECEIDIDDIEDSYQGVWDSDEDFVQQLLEDTGTIPRNLPWYVHIDWEMTARDVMSDYTSHDGHYFRL